MIKSRMDALETVILSHLECCPDGATAADLAYLTGLSVREVSEAITFLAYSEKLRKVGTKRPEGRGRPAAVWGVAGEGE